MDKRQADAFLKAFRAFAESQLTTTQKATVTGRWDASQLIMKVEIKELAPASGPVGTASYGGSLPGQTIALIQACTRHGIDPTLPFRTQAGGQVFTLTDYKSGRPKYPFSATGSAGGRGYKMGLEHVQQGQARFPERGRTKGSGITIKTAAEQELHDAMMEDAPEPTPARTYPSIF